MYGLELIVDLHDCKLKNDLSEISTDLQDFCEQLANHVDMTTEDFHFWSSSLDDEQDPKTWGISAIQFIITSNITVHVLPLYEGGSVYVNLFSCKQFTIQSALDFINGWFEPKRDSFVMVLRE